MQRVEKVFSPRCADFETFRKVSKSCLIERAVGFLPPAHAPRCFFSSVFCGVFQQSDYLFSQFNKIAEFAITSTEPALCTNAPTTGFKVPLMARMMAKKLRAIE